MLNMFQWHYNSAQGDFYVGAVIKKGLKNIEWVLSWRAYLRNRLQRQLWRPQDLRDGGGLGFTVELFLLALRQLLPTSRSQQHSQSSLFVFTFRAITSDWGEYKRSLGTQKILLDAVASPDGVIQRFDYPTYITDELLALLEHILEGQKGPHVEDAVQQLLLPDDRPGIKKFRAKALQVISQSL